MSTIGAINLFPNPILTVVLLSWGILLLPTVNRSTAHRGWHLNGWKRLGIVVAGFIVMITATPSPDSPEIETSPTPAIVASILPSPSLTPTYVRPTVAENGSAFPTTSNYIEGYPKELTDGASTVTIDNSQSGSDIVVKLFSLDTTPAKAVRVFLVRAHDQFTVESVRAGQYDVRYQNLDSGTLSRTEPFELEETDTQFTQLTLSLYLVEGGNLSTYPLSEGEF